MEKKEAMKILKDFHDKSALFSVRTALDTIFPEFAESEDERIRKTIYNCVKWFGFDSCFFKDISQEECLAWLERQEIKEHNVYDTCDEKASCVNPCPVKLIESENERIRKSIIAFLTYYHTGQGNSVKYDDGWIAWLKKQGQTFAKKDIDDAYLKGICDAKHELENKGEKKSSWSEEDEKMLQNILECLRNGWKKLPTDILKYESWLESLKGRVGNFDGGYKVGFFVAKHNQWKPSDEQMEYLAKAITTLGDEGDCKTAIILNDLRFELKKLRGG